MRLRSTMRALWLCTTLMAAVALSATAQENKPNILVIWGDDIGPYNVSAYNMGVMGYRRRISIASPKRASCSPMLRRAKLHRGPGRVHYRPAPYPYRPDQGRHAGREGRHAERGPDHRGAYSSRWLHDRAVRQEPSGRSRRTPADESRVR